MKKDLKKIATQKMRSKERLNQAEFMALDKHNRAKYAKSLLDPKIFTTKNYRQTILATDLKLYKLMYGRTVEFIINKGGFLGWKKETKRKTLLENSLGGGVIEIYLYWPARLQENNRDDEDDDEYEE